MPTGIDSDLRLEWHPTSLNGSLKAEITAWIGDRNLARDNVNLSSDRSRARFRAAVRRADDTINEPGLEAELLRIAAELDADRQKREEKDSGGVGSIEGAGCADEHTIAELAWSRAAGQADFIIFDRESGKVSRARTVETAAGVMVVPAIAAGIVTPGGEIDGTVLLPTECDSAGEDEDRLRDDLRGFLARYVELPGESVNLVVEYVLLTWVHDAFDELPYLAFRTADMGRGKSRALETAGAVSYRPMYVGGGSTAAATLKIIDTFKGTLVADEFDRAGDTELGSTLNKILCQGFQRRRPLVKCDGELNVPRAFHCFGPKLFALRKGFGDDAVESRTLNVRMQQRVRGDIPLCLPRTQFDREALALRNRLLAWRFANRSRIKIDPTLADPGLEDRMNQIGLPLLAVARGEAAQAQITAALREQQGRVAADRAETLVGEVFEAVLKVVDATGIVRPRDVVQEVNRRRAEVEGVEPDKLRHAVRSERVGRVIRQELELPHADPKRDKIGVRYLLTAERREQLCKRLGTPPEPTQPTQPTPTPENHPENGLFDSASGGDVGCVGCVGLAGGPGDNTDAEERAAIQAVEREAELAALGATATPAYARQGEEGQQW